MKILIPHFLWCHYEMIGAFLQYFKEHDIYILISDSIILNEECRSWLRLYSDHFKFNLVIVKENEPFILEDTYDIFINHTDDIKFHNTIKGGYIFSKDLCVYHQNPPRTSIYSNYLPVHGLQNVYENNAYKYRNQPYFSSTWNYINVEDKLKALSSNISVAVIGGLTVEEDNFFNKLINRFINFNEITFYIIGRLTIKDHDNVLPDNIKILNFISAEDMFQILSICHYMYYFTEKRGISSGSGNIPLAYTTLCKLVACKRVKDQYDINIGEFRDNEERFTLNPVGEEDLLSIEKERSVIIENTKNNLNTLLKI